MTEASGPPRVWRLLLVGFGNVGRGVARRLIDAAGELRAHGVEARIVAVLDPACGSVACADGLDPQALLDCVEAGDSLTGLAGGAPVEGIADALARWAPDVVFEMTPTNLVDGGVGLSNVRAALAAGCHVATTNKGPVALAYRELDDLARAHGVQLRCEGTVLSGTPLLNLHESGLVGAGVQGVRGILNGTCNYLLCAMEGGTSFAAALADAQRLGYAETDPSGDVDGWDAAAKVAILGNLVLGEPVALSDVERTGIRDLTPERVAEARGRGAVWRLVGEVRRGADGVHARVAPMELPESDPLAAVRGAGNLVAFETDALGTVTVAGPGAGVDATGHALVADLLAINRATRR